ncbi:MAG: 4-hydroxythreonine-4-phosphate dehydrogenase PdxA [Pseudomonadales bacterium]
MLAVSVGEPAGIGPDICLASLAAAGKLARLWYCGCAETLRERAGMLGLSVQFNLTADWCDGAVNVIDLPLACKVQPGQPDPRNGTAVLGALRAALDACLDGSCQALVTAPINKSVINEAGLAFTGHTEWLCEATGAEQAVMMLAAGKLRVALASTHLPLRNVPDAITFDGLSRTIAIANHALKHQFGIASPRLLVCGLNPHAGEGGHLGSEEIDVITPVIESLQAEGYQLQGPVPADTAFTDARLADVDAVVAMYHDQGLPALKAAGFGEAVNITLGLPVIRTSVDHGTAFDLAGSGKADDRSLLAAIAAAVALVQGSGAAP